MTFSPNLVVPRILWDNLMRSASATVTLFGGSALPQYPLVNAYDWKDWTLFRVQAGTWDIVIRNTAETTLDSFGFFFKRPTYSGATVRLFWESSSGVFSPLTPGITGLETNPLGMESFTAQVVPANRGIMIRFVVPTAQVLDVRQVAVGMKMEPEAGQNVGVSPPSLQQSWKTTNALSVNGSLIGRNLIRLVKDYDINLEYLSKSFVEGSWRTFCTHALRYPFFFKWNPSSFPLDTLFASAKTVDSPSVSKPGQRFTAKMPLVGITE